MTEPLQTDPVQPEPLQSDPLLDPKLTGTTDGAAGETVLPGAPGGPQGGEPAEVTPEAEENDLASDDIDLGETVDPLESDDIASIRGIGE
jgi:hypothetical protein